MVLYYKAWRKCDAAENRGEEAEEVRYLAIEETLQDEIKDTLEHKNQ